MTEICTLANISRGTFYTHYVVYYDLLEKLELEFADNILNIMYEYQFDTDSSPIMNSFVEYVYENADKLFLLLGNQSTGKGLERAYDVLKKQAIPV